MANTYAVVIHVNLNDALEILSASYNGQATNAAGWMKPTGGFELDAEQMKNLVQGIGFIQKQISETVTPVLNAAPLKEIVKEEKVTHKKATRKH